MKDPYQVLGVSKTATTAEIKSAYRKLAKELHPDRNDDPRLTEKFKEASTAYNILSNPAERKRYDQMQHSGTGFSGFSGNQYGQGFSRGFQPGFNPQFTRRRSYNSPDWSAFFEGGGQQRAFYSTGSNKFADLGSMLQQMFGREEVQQPTKTYRQIIKISFLEAALGTQKKLRLPGGKVINLRIPAGSETGKKITLPKIVKQGSQIGDLCLELQVAEDQQFKRDRKDIHLTVKKEQLKQGPDGKVAIPSLRGAVRIKLSADQTKTVRLKGLGIQPPDQSPGDQYVKFV